MVARHKLGHSKRHSGSFQKADARIHNGRPRGSKNRLPTTLKEAILEAMAMSGFNQKGKHGLVGYFLRICNIDLGLGCRLAERILGIQVTGPGGGPVQVMHIPPEMIREMTTEQLELLDGILQKMGKLDKPQPLLIEHQAGDANKYAEEIGLTPVTRH
jgi:hypothetical protein